MIFGWVDRWLQRRASERADFAAERDKWDRLRSKCAEQTRIERESAAEAAMEKAFAPLPEHIREQIRLRVALKDYGWGNIDNGQSPRARFLEHCARVAESMRP